MASNSPSEEAITQFFEGRKFPDREYCNWYAVSFTNYARMSPLAVKGTTGYMVVCSKAIDDPPIIVSFRQEAYEIEERTMKLARAVHPRTVPDTRYHGTMSGSNPTLHVYTMSYDTGIACIKAFSDKAQMAGEQETKHHTFMRYLAEYFGYCWSNPQAVSPDVLAERQAAISRKLVILKALPSPPVSISIISELESILPKLFSSSQPKVLTHGDLSKTNIIVHPYNHVITRINNWSLAEVLPFGLELDALFLMTGYTDSNGWHDYTCRSQLLETFWTQFWMWSKVQEDARENVRKTAEAAARIGAIMRYAFVRNDAGKPSDTLTTSNTTLAMLKAWIRD